MKKLVSLICALALLLCLVPSSFAETTSSEDPVEITYFRQDLARNSVAYYSETAWFQELEKRLNVKIKIIGPASTDDYNTAVNIMMDIGRNFRHLDATRREWGMLHAFGRWYDQPLETEVAPSPNHI